MAAVNTFFSATAFISLTAPSLLPLGLQNKLSLIIMSSSNDGSNQVEEIQKQTMDPVRLNDRKQQQQQQQTPTKKRGRPGIVVFSGGTAFNAAAAEMASRNVASVVTNRVADVSQSNSVNDMTLMTTMMMMGDPSSLSNNNNNNNNNKSISLDNEQAGGGIKVWHVLPVTDDGGSTAEIVRVLGG